MGDVNLALMGVRPHEKLCVIKTLRRDVADPSARARVQRETNISRRLSYGVIAQNFAAGEDRRGAPFLVQKSLPSAMERLRRLTPGMARQ